MIKRKIKKAERNNICDIIDLFDELLEEEEFRVYKLIINCFKFFLEKEIIRKKGEKEN